MRGRGRTGRAVPATAALCGRLMAYIPPQDDADMRRGWGLSSEEAILLSYHLYRPSYVILTEDGEPVGLFGCAPGGQLWMMRGEGIDRVAVQFIRQSGAYLDRWLEEYGVLRAYFWGENRKLARFLAWSGFEVADLGNGYVRCEKWARQSQ